MKTLNIILFIIISYPAIGQSSIDWKTKKNKLFSTIGIATEGCEINFSTQLFKNRRQFIEVDGGAGNFSPNEKEAAIITSGFTYNRGMKNHYFSIGLHTTYASKDDLSLISIQRESAYLSNAQIGYQYSSNALEFKIHVQPLNGISNRISNIGSTASLSFHF